MNLFEVSNQFFNIASVLYAIAFVLYVGDLVSEKKFFSTGSTFVGRAGWFFHTAALGVRWVFSGLGHPPWTNLYESLVFFSWGVMGAHCLLEWRRGFKLTGVFATAVVFAAMGVASLHPHKEVEPLVPALQSWWLLFHVFMACIAYAFFLASSFVSVFYLLKEKVPVHKMASVAAFVCVLFLAIAAGKSFFTDNTIQFFKISQMPNQAGAMQEVIMDFKGADGKPMQQFVALKYATPFFWSLLLLYLASGLLLVKAAVGDQKYKYGKLLFHVAMVIHFALLIHVLVAPKFVAGMALKSNPYRLAAILMTLLISAFFGLLFRLGDRIEKRLPTLTVLDRWSYETILVGVPFMTINLISGAVWAYYAWGRYWGWDPKETWALITWFIYVIYLHMRILAGWSGYKTALISIFGFFVVIFTYLGVNLVISGLHSYATG